MDYKEFVDRVAEEIGNRLPEPLKNAEIVTRQVDKLQGEGYYGITVNPANSNVGISFDLQKVYERTGNGRDMEAALDAVAHLIPESFADRPNVKASDLKDYETMKKTLMIQVVPTAGNEDMLSTIPHTEKEDMSMVYRFVISTDDRGTASVLATNQMLENYGITPEQLHADAMAMAPECFPADVRGMQEILAEMMGLPPEMVGDNPSEMYVATCNHGVYGAGCIFYPDFMKQAAEKLGGDYFILPSSVHEVILLPDNGTVSHRELQSMVKEINATEVAPEDWLSDNVYHYDSKAQIFERAETYRDRQQQKQQAMYRRNPLAARNKARFPKGTIVQLDDMAGERDMPAGLRGKVTMVDDIGQVHVAWENGRSLALNTEQDSFKVIKTPKKKRDDMSR